MQTRRLGELVRPLSRKRKGNEIAASQPDHQYHFTHEGREIVVHVWHDLVLTQTHVSADAATFSIYAYHDPLYKQALVLGTNLGKIKAETAYDISTATAGRWNSLR